MKESFTRKVFRTFPYAVLLVVSGCIDHALPTAPESPIPVQANRAIQYSDDFYPDGNGYYWWTGNPPAGDLGPTDISAASATAHASVPQSWTWVAANITHDGDQWLADINYSVQHEGAPVYSNSTANSNWQWSVHSYSRMQVQENWSKDITLPEYWDCAVAVQAGGTVYSRKAVPFAISVSVLKFHVSITLGTISWGESSRPMLAASDPGVDCNEVIHQPPPSGNPGGGTPATQYQGWYAGPSWPGGTMGGTPHCVEWVHWFVSYDGGRSWYYQNSECTRTEVS